MGDRKCPSPEGRFLWGARSPPQARWSAANGAAVRPRRGVLRVFDTSENRHESAVDRVRLEDPPTLESAHEAVHLREALLEEKGRGIEARVAMVATHDDGPISIGGRDEVHHV